MAKLSNILINSFLSLTYANNFGVTNCSNDVHTIWIFPAIMMVSNNWFLSLGPQNFISDIILSHTVQTTGTKISYGTSTIRLV